MTSPATETPRTRYQALRAQLWLDRSSFDAHWREIAQYLFPVRPRFTITQHNRGERRNQSIIDSTATFAKTTLQSGMHAGLTSPARPWMKLSTPDPSLAKTPAVKQWLYDVTERMLTVFQLSNLYNALPIVYGDMATFGTAAVGILDDPGNGSRSGDLFRAYPYPIGSYALATDNRGLITTFVREYVKSVGQLVEEFGGPDGQPLRKHGDPIDWTRFSLAVKTAWDRGNYEWPVTVTWTVTPNRQHDQAALGLRGFPWISCHEEQGLEAAPGSASVAAPSERTSGPLRESGYYEFPILAPRWFCNAEDTYGTDCPGMMALGDIKQLQTQQRRKGQAIEKLVNPPLVGPTSLRTQKTSLLPGDITYADTREGLQGLRPVHEVRPDLQHFVIDIEDTRRRINQAFYVDLFLMLASQDASRGAQPLTAREVDERHEEKLLALGPVLESTIDELLDPLVDRVFAMMSREGLIPPAPPDLHGVELTVEYISIMAQAQKLVSVVAQDRFISTLTGIAAVLPDVVMKLDSDELVDSYAEQLGVNPKIVRSTDDANALRQQHAQAAQQQAAAEQLQAAGRGAQALANAPLDQGDTALKRIIEGVTAG